MIADRERAIAVSRAAEELIKHLSLAMQSAHANASKEDFERLRKASGYVIGALEANLLSPLYAQYPDLEPAKLKRPSAGS
jgi:hypothetical protein